MINRNSVDGFEFSSFYIGFRLVLFLRNFFVPALLVQQHWCASFPLHHEHIVSINVANVAGNCTWYNPIASFPYCPWTTSMTLYDTLYNAWKVGGFYWSWWGKQNEEYSIDEYFTIDDGVGAHGVDNRSWRWKGSCRKKNRKRESGVKGDWIERRQYWVSFWAGLAAQKIKLKGAWIHQQWVTSTMGEDKGVQFEKCGKVKREWIEDWGLMWDLLWWVARLLLIIVMVWDEVIVS